MIVSNTYRESLRPGPAAASGLLAMADGVSIVIERTSIIIDIVRSRTKRSDSDTQRALVYEPRALSSVPLDRRTAVPVAAVVTSRKARDRFTCTDDPKRQGKG